MPKAVVYITLYTVYEPDITAVGRPDLAQVQSSG